MVKNDLNDAPEPKLAKRIKRRRNKRRRRVLGE